jgi:hypothetical protein
MHFVMDNRIFEDVKSSSSVEESNASNDMLLFSNSFHPVPDHLLSYQDNGFVLDHGIFQGSHNPMVQTYEDNQMSYYVRRSRHTVGPVAEHDHRFLSNDNPFTMQRINSQIPCRSESLQSQNRRCHSMTSPPDSIDSRNLRRRHSFGIEDIDSSVKAYPRNGEDDTILNGTQPHRQNVVEKKRGIFQESASSSKGKISKSYPVLANELMQLPCTFQPGPQDVICGRGKFTSEHEGNLVFREILEASVQEYAAATSKLDKSLIVSAIIRKYEERNPNGSFVRYSNNCWNKLGESMTREKCGHWYVF